MKSGSNEEATECRMRRAKTHQAKNAQTAQIRRAQTARTRRDRYVTLHTQPAAMDIIGTSQLKQTYIYDAKICAATS